jgi:hypothetical protein
VGWWGFGRATATVTPKWEAGRMGREVVCIEECETRGARGEEMVQAD